jgi:hypothetical protein
LAEETGLSERSVCTHLEKAAKAGWVKKSRRGCKGRDWKLTEYTPTIPDKALKEIQHPNTEGTETVSAPQAKGTEPRSNEVLKEVQSSTSIEHSNTPPNPPKGKRALVPGWLDRRVWSEFKKMRQTMKAPITHFAEGLLLTKLNRFREAGHDPNEILNTSIENSWRGVFEPKRPATTYQIPTPRAEEYDLENLIHRET